MFLGFMLRHRNLKIVLRRTENNKCSNCQSLPNPTPRLHRYSPWTNDLFKTVQSILPELLLNIFCNYSLFKMQSQQNRCLCLYRHTPTQGLDSVNILFCNLKENSENTTVSHRIALSNICRSSKLYLTETLQIQVQHKAQERSSVCGSNASIQNCMTGQLNSKGLQFSCSQQCMILMLAM